MSLLLIDVLDIILSMTKTRTNEEWSHDLNTSGEVQEAAIADLRDLLLRAVLFFFSRNLGDFERLGRDEILQLAEDCAQDALIAVMNHLSEFRGDSKFTTWAYKFAINIALMTARRERWKGKSLDQLSFYNNSTLFEWIRQDGSSGLIPDRSVVQDEIRDIIQEVIEHELTDKQRQVLMMMIFNDVPIDVVVQQLGTNRNAVYKLLHDARLRLRTRLAREEIAPYEVLALFEQR